LGSLSSALRASRGAANTAASLRGERSTPTAVSNCLTLYCKLVLSLSSNLAKRPWFDRNAELYSRGLVATPSSIVGEVIGMVPVQPRRARTTQCPDRAPTSRPGPPEGGSPGARGTSTLRSRERLISPRLPTAEGKKMLTVSGHRHELKTRAPSCLCD